MLHIWLRTVLLGLALAVAPGCLLSQAPPSAAGATSGTTTIAVVRHAEKATDDARDPSLSPAGELRAAALVSVLDAAQVAAIYSTQFKRTRSTAEPLARQLGLTVVEREINSANATIYAEMLARDILSRHAGESVVVVGHSNTVPQIVHALSGHEIGELTEQEYDHFFLVVVPAQGAARLFKLRYGAADVR